MCPYVHESNACSRIFINFVIKVSNFAYKHHITLNFTCLLSLLFDWVGGSYRRSQYYCSRHIFNFYFILEELWGELRVRSLKLVRSDHSISYFENLSGALALPNLWDDVSYIILMINFIFLFSLVCLY